MKSQVSRSRWRHLPNGITLLRIGLVGPIVYTLHHLAYDVAFALFVGAALSDGLDGYLARRFGWFSHFGSVVDPLADKVLLICIFWTLFQQGWVSPLMVGVVIGREMVIVWGALAYRLWIGPYQMEPRWLSKLHTTCLLIYGMVIVYTAAQGPGSSLLIQYLAFCEGIAIATALCSTLDYTWIWGHKAWSQRGRHSPPVDPA